MKFPKYISDHTFNFFSLVNFGNYHNLQHMVRKIEVAANEETTLNNQWKVFYNTKEKFVSEFWKTDKDAFVWFFVYRCIKASSIQSFFKLSLYRYLRLTKINFCTTIPETGFCR